MSAVDVSLGLIAKSTDSKGLSGLGGCSAVPALGNTPNVRLHLPIVAPCSSIHYSQSIHKGHVVKEFPAVGIVHRTDDHIELGVELFGLVLC